MNSSPQIVDVVVLGAGGAGMMCGATAARRGRKVVILDHADKLGKKILISGGGRCNFTNINANHKTYFSENEHFCKSAFARFTPADFLELIRKHRVPFHEKKLGQLFCDDTAMRIVDLLLAECREAGAKIELACKILSVNRLEEQLAGQSSRFTVETSIGVYHAESVVVATGGPSIPKIGATDFGQRLAKSLGLEVTALAPALVSLTLDKDFLKKFGELSGVSVDSEVKIHKQVYRENILFTHTGLSGPAILQASLYWNPGDELLINLSPDRNIGEFLLEKKRSGSKAEVKNLLTDTFTKRFAEIFTEAYLEGDGPIANLADAKIQKFADTIHRWRLKPVDTGGYGKAEVTRGGVSTNELSSKMLEAKKVPGLFFIGEVVDVTGWLGGYNFQWAWASGAAAGDYV